MGTHARILATGVVAVLAAAVTITFCPGPARAVSQVVFPPDRALLQDPAVEVLGVRDGEPSAAAFTVTGLSGALSHAVPAGVFRVAVKLAAGENTIEYAGAKLTVFVAAAGAAQPGERFSPPDLHAVDNGCEDCHAVAGAKLPLSSSLPDLCANCHDAVAQGKDGKAHAVAHPPVDEGDCKACHAPHGLAIKRLAPAAKRELCFSCHDDFTGGGKKRMHKPVAAGECTGCHLPHGAPVKALLPAAGLKLCLLCHKDPSLTPEGEAWAVPHPALDDGCPSCHQAHAADARNLLAKPQAALCFGCHDNFLEGGGEKDAVVHAPVADGECGGCHNPHGSAKGKLLRAEGLALCVRCHEDPTRDAGGKEWATPHPALDDGCPSCHLPHRSDAPGLLKKAQAPLCFDCHETFAGAATEGKPLALHLPVAQGKCTACHAPHGAATGKLLAASPAQELCLTCHKNPALDAAGAEWATPHPALDDGCPACHLPHASPIPKLLPKPQAALCAGCHEDKNLNGEGMEWSTPHTPVRSGLCSSCHAPHGAAEKALLPKQVVETCATCHAEPHVNHLRVEIDSSGKPVVERAVLPAGFPVRKKDGALGCNGCHLPHGSDAPRLWNRDESTFCSTCHNKY